MAELDEEHGWKLTALGDLCDINPRKRDVALPPETPILFVPMAAVDEVTGTIATPTNRTLKDVYKKSYRHFEPRDVIFAKITPCMENGKSAVVPDIPSGIGYGSTEFHVLRPKPGTNPRFIWHYVRSRAFRANAAEHMTGSVGQLRVPASFLEDHLMSAPPLPIQDEIVRLLDGAIASGRSAVVHLATARRALHQFRQSILAAACSGRLTAEWREGKSSIVVEPGLAERSSNLALEESADEFPETWVLAAIGDVGEVQLGGTPSRKVSAYWNGGVPWVSSGEVANCRITSTRETISESGLAKSSAKLYPPGTVLIAMIGEGKTRGQAAILDIEACTNQNAAGITADVRYLNPEYLWRWALAQYEITRAVGRGGNQPALNKQKVRELVIAVPPLAEQEEIVRRVDALLALAEVAQRRVEIASSRLDRNSEAILAKAFRSELTGAAAA